MKRITISLTDSLYNSITVQARRYHCPLSKAVIARILANNHELTRGQYNRYIAEQMLARRQYVYLRDILTEDSFNLEQLEYLAKHNADKGLLAKYLPTDRLTHLSKSVSQVRKKLAKMPILIKYINHPHLAEQRLKH